MTHYSLLMEKNLGTSVTRFFFKVRCAPLTHQYLAYVSIFIFLPIFSNCLYLDIELCFLFYFLNKFN